MRYALLPVALLLAGSLHAQEHEHHHEQSAPAQSNARASSQGPTQSESEHVPPDPPASELGDMTYRTMADMMDMDDKTRVGKVLLDQLDWRDADGGNALAWDAQAYYGTDYNKLWLKTEGEHTNEATEDARVELLWDRIVSRWWSAQAGVRHDFGVGPSRDWLAVGVQGLAPYFFEVEATAYIGDAGRTAARFKAEYELLFTQRLILTPEVELNLYGKDDPERKIMAGVTHAEVALRLRYEIRREIAPYVGIAWIHRFGRTADLFRAAGDDPSEVEALAGIRIWF
jgi:copper resistance protein B